MCNYDYDRNTFGKASIHLLTVNLSYLDIFLNWTCKNFTTELLLIVNFLATLEWYVEAYFIERRKQLVKKFFENYSLE